MYIYCNQDFTLTTLSLNLPIAVMWIVSCFLVFSIVNSAVQYLTIPREEVELDDVTSYNIFDNKIYKISS